jgi:hypothetical protein
MSRRFANDFTHMKNRLLRFGAVVGLVAIALGQEKDREPGAILDGPNYAFSLQTPVGWTMTGTNAHGYVAEYRKKAEGPVRAAVVLNVNSVDKARQHVNNPAEVNAADLAGIRKEEPTAESKLVAEISTGDRRKIPVYSFSYGRFRELVAYADEPKTVTIFVLSSEDEEALRAARSALDELVKTYVFLTDNFHGPETK